MPRDAGSAPMVTLDGMSNDSHEDGAATCRAISPGDETPLLDLLQGLDTTYFRPHPFTAIEVHRIATRAGHDLNGMLMVGRRLVAYGMLRGWDEGYETPSPRGGSSHRLAGPGLHDGEERGESVMVLDLHHDRVARRAGPASIRTPGSDDINAPEGR